ncbi:ankyrin repeat domain-containing protein [Maribacter antarcticus]|uniref:ankyrin repeat domain-containing protein n=1 Tax=Maribacter antarcticus TaxID=505250 RepID=UPI00047D95CF|nr:ankyrin repeat domain-containing protein [Maribacter antarcticus]
MIRLLLLTAMILITSLSLNAQDKNEFLDREFWKSDPSVSLIKKTIEDGHDPTQKGPSSFDGVSYAILDDASLASIKYMLTLEGNPVTKPTHGGLKYLHWAAYKGNIAVMKHLLALGADPHARTAQGTNMLLIAATGGVQKTAVYDLILKQGISADYTNRSGANALLLLSGTSSKDTAILNYFIDKKIALNTKDNEGNNLFFYAARGGNINTMKFWKQNGVAHNYINKNGENAILFASQGMKRKALRLDVFTYLSEELSLEVDQVSWEGKTPLHFSAKRATPELFDFFVSAGVSPNQVDADGNTALINAASGSKENLEKMLDLSNTINHQNKEGKSSITMAIEGGRKDNFDFLRNKGADLHGMDSLGNDLMYYAFISYNSKKEDLTKYIVTQLEIAGLDGKSIYHNKNTLAHIAIKKQSVFLLKKAIELGVDLNYKNDIHISPLHLAAMKATNTELITVLLKQGADKNTVTEFNESPYDLAIQNELLMNEKVDVAFLKMD